MSGKLEQRIQSAHLTRTEKVIADYFLEHSGSLYFLTAKDIALALGVSDTSVIRLCRTLGYRGFRELQESLRSSSHRSSSVKNTSSRSIRCRTNCKSIRI